MAKKPSKHDQKVRKIAKDLEKDDWNVQADISGFDTPDGIGKENRIPDIVAKKKGAAVIAFTGKANSELEEIADVCLCADAPNTFGAQQIHQIAYHLICDLVERDVCKKQADN